MVLKIYPFSIKSVAPCSQKIKLNYRYTLVLKRKRNNCLCTHMRYLVPLQGVQFKNSEKKES